MSLRQKWIDYIKVFACILIAMGHLVQGLTRSGILAESIYIQYILWMIYLFHVNIFFMCSGYLYQKTNKVTSLAAYKNNIINKFISLGVPYFAFAIITWLLKKIGNSYTNLESGSLFHFLFIEPATAPYWYLYTLFLLFLIIPNFNKKSTGLIMQILFGILYLFSNNFTFNFALMSIMEYGFWFVLGMNLCTTLSERKSDKKELVYSILFLLLFITICHSVYFSGISASFNAWTLLLGILSVIGFTFFFRIFEKKISRIPDIDEFAGYTFPIYLMHTIFMGGIRSLLLKMSVTSIYIHLLFGIFAAFMLPIIVTDIFKKLRYPYKLIYPLK